MVIFVVKVPERAPAASVAPEALTVSCQLSESASALSVQPDVVGSLKSTSVPVLSQNAVGAEAASDTDHPASAASGFLT